MKRSAFLRSLVALPTVFFADKLRVSEPELVLPAAVDDFDSFCQEINVEDLRQWQMDVSREMKYRQQRKSRELRRIMESLMMGVAP